MLPVYNDLEQELYQKKVLKDNKRQLTENQNPGGTTLNPEFSRYSSEGSLMMSISCTSYLSH